MKTVRLTITFLFCSIFAISFAQTTKQKVFFHSQEQLGLLNGNGAVSAGMQSVNGLEMGNWFAGLGVGIDFYRYRSVPLFVDVKRYFKIANGNRLFFYGDGGYNFPWSEGDEELFSSWGGTTKIERDGKGGTYFDTGGGYAIPFRKANALLLSLGFSHKYFSEKVVTVHLVGSDAIATDIQHYSYSFNRIIIKIGWQF